MHTKEQILKRENTSAEQNKAAVKWGLEKNDLIAGADLTAEFCLGYVLSKMARFFNEVLQPLP